MKRFVVVVFVMFCTLSCFSYGTAMMDYFLIYPSRAIVGVNEFVEYHELLGAAILPVSVLPFFIITILNGILMWKRPPGVTKSLVAVSFICLLLDWGSTIFIQIPMNIELNQGKNIELIQAVMDTNWPRIALETLQVILVFAMMLKCLSKFAESSEE